MCTTLTTFSDSSPYLLLDDAFFYQVRDSITTMTDNVFTRFVKDIIMELPNTVVLRNLSDVYILVARAMSDRGNVKWDEVLPPEFNTKLKRDRHLILGWVLLDVRYDESVKYISYIDTVVPDLGIANYMIQRLEGKLQSHKTRYVLPYEIIPSSTDYWVRWFASHLRHHDHDWTYSQDISDEITYFEYDTTLGNLFGVNTPLWSSWTVKFVCHEDNMSGKIIESLIFINDGLDTYRIQYEW